jgi:hypothetical protein
MSGNTDIRQALRFVAAGVLASATALMLAACGGSGSARHSADANAVAPTIVEINGSSPVWRDKLIQAVGTPNTTVRLAPNVDMDMTGLTDPIYFAQGVTLTSEHPAGPVAKGSRQPAVTVRPPGPTFLVPGRTPFKPTPCLYTTATRPSTLL